LRDFHAGYPFASNGQRERISHSFIRRTRIASLISGLAFILIKILHKGSLARVLTKIEERLAEIKELGSSTTSIFLFLR
jgi:hypothetical protein